MISKNLQTALPWNFHPEAGARIGLLPKYAKDASQLRWFDLPGFFAFHTANAWQEGHLVYLYVAAFDDVSCCYKFNSPPPPPPPPRCPLAFHIDNAWQAGSLVNLYVAAFENVSCRYESNAPPPPLPSFFIALLPNSKRAWQCTLC